MRTVWIVNWLTPSIAAFEWRYDELNARKALREVCDSGDMQIEALQFFSAETDAPEDEMEDWLRENVELL